SDESGSSRKVGRDAFAMGPWRSSPTPIRPPDISNASCPAQGQAAVGNQPSAISYQLLTVPSFDTLLEQTGFAKRLARTLITDRSEDLSHVTRRRCRSVCFLPRKPAS